jgi:hypothetical protein
MPSPDGNGSGYTDSLPPDKQRRGSEPPRSAGDSGPGPAGRKPTQRPPEPRPDRGEPPPEPGSHSALLDVGGTTGVRTFEGGVRCPRLVGDYEVLRLRGGGGMGHVFVARNQFFDHDQALKTIRQRLDSPEARQRFIDEMRAQSRLNHRNIARVHYAGMYKRRGEFAGMLYFVMSLEKEDLGDVIERTGPFPPADAANLVRRVAKAIAHAHARKVIHCDLKPRNILLGSDGSPRVTDFGLVKFLTDVRDAQVGASSPFGTPSYMPPEQAEGRYDRVTERSDVYGLGAVLYELLTGQPPYTGATKEEILAQVRDPKKLPAPPRELNPKVPARLGAICLRCLKKYPYQRYASAREVAHELRLYLRPPLWKRRWKAAAGILVCGGLAWAGWDRLPKPRAEAAAAEARAEEAARQDDLGEARKHSQEAGQIYQKLIDGSLVLDREELKGKLDHVGKRFGEIDKREREQKRAAELAAAEVYQADATAARRDGDVERAIKSLGAEADVYQKVLTRDASPEADAEVRGRLVQALARRADLYVNQRELARADRVLDQAEQVGGAAKATPPELALALAEVYHVRGFHSFLDAQFVKARDQYDRGLKSRLKLKDQRHDDDFRRDLARSHGYLGDAQLLTGQAAEARTSYLEAKHLREELARKAPEDIEAQCLHARDFGNLAGYYEWVGGVDEIKQAEEEHRRRLAHFKKCIEPLQSQLLPAAHLTERAETRVALAELLLDRADRPAAEVRELFEAALDEFTQVRQVRGNQPEDKCSPQVRSPLARAYLAKGRYHYRLGSDPQAKEARQALEQAKTLLTTLEDENKIQPEDYYNFAATHALLAAVEPLELKRLSYQVLALDDLAKAVRVGFRRLKRLQRDHALALLRDAHPDDFAKVVKDLEGRLNRAAGRPHGEGGR